MKQEEQAQVLESFRRGEFSVLVATSIAEGGLDIPEVDLQEAFFFFDSLITKLRDSTKKSLYSESHSHICSSHAFLVLLVFERRQLSKQYHYFNEDTFHEFLRQIHSRMLLLLRQGPSAL